MLDLERLDRLNLVQRPFTHRFFGRLLHANYRWLPGVELELENASAIPSGPVLFAMNHTDRYNYWPFQYLLWQRFDRYTATWVKGKYYESRLLALFMERMLQLPTVSRGYLITKDFQSVLGRTPTDREYELLRTAVDARAVGDAVAALEPPDVPEMLLRKARDPLGVAYDPGKSDYPDYVCSLFTSMMARFVALNESARDTGLDLLIFPQGTRSVRLLPSHIGIAQMALHLRVPIVPVGCNGSDRIYPGSSPFAQRGRVVYRVGAPISYESLAPFHVPDGFRPFSAEVERDHAKAFHQVAALVTERLEGLLDPEYRSERDASSDASRSSDRFV